MVVNYLEKTSENFRSGTVNCKIIEKQKIYITFNHVLYPEVPIEDLKLRMEDYQLLSEITIITRVNYDRATWKINLKNC